MLKVGLIGCGGISPVHVNGFQATGAAKVTHIYDVDESCLAKRADEWEATPLPSGQAVIESDVDILVIATPGFARLDYMLAAAASGKHLMSEKPIALNLEDAEAMRAAVAASPGVFLTNFTQRCNPPLVTLQRAQQEGRIGGTVSAWARLHAPAPSARWREIEASGHWRSSKELSGGRINEFCSHTVNWLLWVLGKPQTVYGRALCVTAGFGLDDADYALIECENGTGLLEVNRHAAVAPEENYGILGHRGSVVVKDGAIRLTAMDGKPEELPLADNVPSPHQHMINCIQTGTAPNNGIDQAIDTLKVCLAFNRSAESGKVEMV
ncbi:MAG: Gfo/Idh/MocA family oxidoreductase [Lentisphaerae bacterium]|jgi:predicted dehydrogenase|nr:Gfo/Idh/MocA family oxidoreductase [Lentisphaerota bacterium]MBT4819285.1 Gfo/Idh/MocA family oxidoreductase [Lentisphaerota bacterium]MBT5610537.1 Gfo/Idh/MocA family oxidoreductase [Lentisphaerota bacterium]MBT7054409.1 Gfo/Idh/MocA family oxidoreductase [Lentisphaerota bacterium]MBT7842578.1 Gfo/Idh/MocA family oxidoreductase [Lentisphaerota bacterium]